jgi:hypothetical protein
MLFGLPTLRTDTEFRATRRKKAAHSTAPSAALALSLSATCIHSPTSSIHDICLLPIIAMHSPLSQAFPPAATRHDKGIVFQTASEPGPNNLPPIACDERNHLNAIAVDCYMQGSGYSAANQSIDAQFHQPKCPLDRQVLQQRFLCFAQDPVGLGFNNTDLPGCIEDWCNSFVPDCKCYFHCSEPSRHPLIELATVGPQIRRVWWQPTCD